MINALSFDVEEWYHGNLLGFSEHEKARFESRVVPVTSRIMDLLSEAGVKATFFFLGVVARDHAELVRRAVSEGHEIACHGWDHRLLYRIPEDRVKQELSSSKALLEDISGGKVRGFRAPSWSITSSSLNLLRLVRECGFEYDSSVFPMRIPLYGVRGVDPKPARLSGRDAKGEWNIVEFPPAVLDTGFSLRVPFGGGFFLRMWPYPLIRRWIRALNSRGCPAMIYIHPWEIDTGLPGSISPVRRVARDLNLRSTIPKLRGILKDFRTGTAFEVLRNAGLL